MSKKRHRKITTLKETSITPCNIWMKHLETLASHGCLLASTVLYITADENL